MRIVSLIASATEIVCALGFEEQLVGNVEMRQMRIASAMVSVVAEKHQVSLLQPSLGLEFLDYLADQPIGQRDRTASDSELTAAELMTDGVGFGQPDDCDRAFLAEQMLNCEVRIGVVDVFPRFL